MGPAYPGGHQQLCTGDGRDEEVVEIGMSVVPQTIQKEE